ncbi:MAG TPA: NAD(+) kinase [Gammaproteobacteria bacterium]
MKYKFENVGFWGRLSESKVAETALKVIARLKTRNARIAAPPSAAGIAAQAGGLEIVDEADLASKVDVIVAIGGDGTMLHAARRVAGLGVPLLGINLGRLGFLTDILPEHAVDTIDAILSGDYLAEERRMLEAHLLRNGEARPPMAALNDVVLQKGATGRILDFVTWVDGSYVNTHGGDGLIVATPTGSTAYALSCGGPIIQPDLNAIVMVPICPHTLSDRPLVLNPKSVIDVRLHSGSAPAAQISCDGDDYGSIDPEDTLRIRMAPQTITLLHPRDYNYYELLRSKLNWGSATRFGRSGPRS